MWFIVASIVALLTAFFAKHRRYRWFYILAKTYKRDIRAGISLLKIHISTWWWRWHNNTVAATFDENVKKHPNKVAFYYEDNVWTFAEVAAFSNKVARYFKSEGLDRGDSVALLLENGAEYPGLWLGLSRLGVVTALINTNLVQDTLTHSITVCNAKAVIYGSNHAEPIKNIRENIKHLKFYQFHENPKEVKELLTDSVDLRKKLDDVSPKPLDKKDLKAQTTDPLIYIFTSGTTGLPKAAIITNLRYLLMPTALNTIGRFKKTDILYDPLPLYHTAGGMMGIGQTFVKGLSLVIRKKFSASNYWKDCAKYNCTIGQYVGEICRYLLATPQKEPVKHSVRAIFGNGLRPQIWTQFVDTFGIKEVFEFYGATEGISNMINVDNTVGGIGFVPRYAKWFYPVILIRCDEATGEPIKDKNGFCIPCKVNEPGLVIARIDPKKAVFTFHGYSDKKASKKKVLENVFRQGDQYFNSGDVLVYDEFGSYFFKDRTGDTFRWKGENVSTTEVEGVISNVVQLNDAVVFGVEIPNTEGRAGMAAIVDTEKTLDIDKLSNGVKLNLPVYAIPLFVRVLDSVPMTGTYKLKKVELQAEGYDVNNIKDDLYFYNSKLAKYVPLTKELHQAILDGKVNF